MEEIICTIPWHCGERGCPVGWHKANYWICSDGTISVDNYTDGDHDPCEEGEIPDYDQVSKAWLDYARDVVETGADPLCEYNVKYSIEREQVWQAMFRNSILGCVCSGVRKNGRGAWIKPQDAPEEVRDYLCLEPYSDTGSGPLVFKEGMEQLKQYVAEDHHPVQRDRYALKFKFPVTINTPRPESAVRRDIIAAARRHLRNSVITTQPAG